MQTELQFLQKEETRRSGLLLHLVVETVELNRTFLVGQRHMQLQPAGRAVVGHGQRLQPVQELRDKGLPVEQVSTVQTIREQGEGVQAP